MHSSRAKRSYRPGPRGPLPGSARRLVKTLGTRFGWALGDQVVSSLSNFVAAVVVARQLGPVGFGVFTLAWVTYSQMLIVSRGLATDPLMVRHGGRGATAEVRTAAAQATGTALVIGTVLGALVLGAGAVLPERFGSAFLALGLVLPGVLLQDAWRAVFFASGQGRKAFVNDLVWALVLAPALLLAGSVHSTSGYVLAWGGAGWVAALYGAAQSRSLPRPGFARTWLRTHRDLNVRYMIENLSGGASWQIRVYGLGAISGLAAVGVVRGAEQMLGLFATFVIGLALVSVAEAARVLRIGPDRLRRFCLLLGIAEAVAAAAWGVVLMSVLPDRLGSALFGSFWHASAQLLLPVTVAGAAVGLTAGATTGLRALGNARLSLRAQLINSALYAAGGVGGAAAAGAPGSAWGAAAGLCFAAGNWWFTFNHALRAHPASAPQLEQGDQPLRATTAVATA